MRLRGSRIGQAQKKELSFGKQKTVNTTLSALCNETSAIAFAITSAGTFPKTGRPRDGWLMAGIGGLCDETLQNVLIVRVTFTDDRK